MQRHFNDVSAESDPDLSLTVSFSDSEAFGTLGVPVTRAGGSSSGIHTHSHSGRRTTPRSGDHHRSARDGRTSSSVRPPPSRQSTADRITSRRKTGSRRSSRGRNSLLPSDLPLPMHRDRHHHSPPESSPSIAAVSRPLRTLITPPRVLSSPPDESRHSSSLRRHSRSAADTGGAGVDSAHSMVRIGHRRHSFSEDDSDSGSSSDSSRRTRGRRVSISRKRSLSIDGSPAGGGLVTLRADTIGARRVRPHQQLTPVMSSSSAAALASPAMASSVGGRRENFELFATLVLPTPGADRHSHHTPVAARMTSDSSVMYATPSLEFPSPPRDIAFAPTKGGSGGVGSELPSATVIRHLPSRERVFPVVGQSGHSHAPPQQSAQTSHRAGHAPPSSQVLSPLDPPMRVRDLSSELISDADLSVQPARDLRSSPRRMRQSRRTSRSSGSSATKLTINRSSASGSKLRNELMQPTRKHTDSVASKSSKGRSLKEPKPRKRRRSKHLAARSELSEGSTKRSETGDFVMPRKDLPMHQTPQFTADDALLMGGPKISEDFTLHSSDHGRLMPIAGSSVSIRKEEYVYPGSKPRGRSRERRKSAQYSGHLAGVSRVAAVSQRTSVHKKTKSMGLPGDHEWNAPRAERMHRTKSIKSITSPSVGGGGGSISGRSTRLSFSSCDIRYSTPVFDSTVVLRERMEISSPLIAKSESGGSPASSHSRRNSAHFTDVGTRQRLENLSWDIPDEVVVDMDWLRKELIPKIHSDIDAALAERAKEEIEEIKATFKTQLDEYWKRWSPIHEYQKSECERLTVLQERDKRKNTELQRKLLEMQEEKAKLAADLRASKSEVIDLKSKLQRNKQMLAQQKKESTIGSGLSSASSSRSGSSSSRHFRLGSVGAAEFVVPSSDIGIIVENLAKIPIDSGMSMTVRKLNEGVCYDPTVMEDDSSSVSSSLVQRREEGREESNLQLSASSLRELADVSELLRDFTNYESSDSRGTDNIHQLQMVTEKLKRVVKGVWTLTSSLHIECSNNIDRFVSKISEEFRQPNLTSTLDDRLRVMLSQTTVGFGSRESQSASSSDSEDITIREEGMPMSSDVTIMNEDEQSVFRLLIRLQRFDEVLSTLLSVLVSLANKLSVADKKMSEAIARLLPIPNRLGELDVSGSLIDLKPVDQLELFSECLPDMVDQHLSRHHRNISILEKELHNAGVRIQDLILRVNAASAMPVDLSELDYGGGSGLPSEISEGSRSSLDIGRSGSSVSFMGSSVTGPTSSSSSSSHSSSSSALSLMDQILTLDKMVEALVQNALDEQSLNRTASEKVESTIADACETLRKLPGLLGEDSIKFDPPPLKDGSGVRLTMEEELAHVADSLAEIISDKQRVVSTRMADLENQVFFLKQNEEDLKAKNDELTDHMSKKVDEMHRSQSALLQETAEKEEQIARLNKEMISVTHGRDRAMSEADHLRAKVLILKDEQADLVKEKESVELAHLSLTETISEMTVQLSQAKEEGAEWQGKLEQQLNDYQTELNEVKLRNDELQSEKEAIDEKYRLVEEEMGRLEEENESKFAELKTEVSGLRKHLESANDQIEMLIAKKEELELEHLEISEQLKTNQEELATINLEKSELKELVSQKKREIDDLSEQISLSTAKLSDSKERSDEEMDTLRAQLDNLRCEKSVLEHSLEETREILKSGTADKEAKMVELRQQCEMLSESLEKSKESHIKVENEKRELMKQQETLSNELRNVREDLLKTNEDFSRSELETRELRSELEKTKQEFEEKTTKHHEQITKYVSEKLTKRMKDVRKMMAAFGLEPVEIPLHKSMKKKRMVTEGDSEGTEEKEESTEEDLALPDVLDSFKQFMAGFARQMQPVYRNIKKLEKERKSLNTQIEQLQEEKTAMVAAVEAAEAAAEAAAAVAKEEEHVSQESMRSSEELESALQMSRQNEKEYASQLSRVEQELNELRERAGQINSKLSEVFAASAMIDDGTDPMVALEQLAEKSLSEMEKMQKEQSDLDEMVSKYSELEKQHEMLRKRMGVQQKMAKRQLTSRLLSKRKGKKTSDVSEEHSEEEEEGGSHSEDEDGEHLDEERKGSRWRFRGKSKVSSSASASSWAQRSPKDELSDEKSYGKRRSREFKDQKHRLFFLPENGKLENFRDVQSEEMMPVECVSDISAHFEGFCLATLGIHGRILFWKVIVDQPDLEVDQFVYSVECTHSAHLPLFHVRQHLTKQAAKRVGDHPVGRRLRFSSKGRFCAVVGSTDPQENIGVMYFFRMVTSDEFEQTEPLFMNACVTSMADFFSKEQSRKVLDTTSSVVESGDFPFYGLNSVVFTADERHCFAGDGKGNVVLFRLMDQHQSVVDEDDEDESSDEEDSLEQEWKCVKLFRTGFVARILDMSILEDSSEEEETSSHGPILFMATDEDKVVRCAFVQKLLDECESDEKSEDDDDYSRNTICEDTSLFIPVAKATNDRYPTRSISCNEGRIYIGSRKMTRYSIGKVSIRKRSLQLKVDKHYNRDSVKDKSISKDVIGSVKTSFGGVCLATRQIKGDGSPGKVVTMIKPRMNEVMSDEDGLVQRMDLKSSAHITNGLKKMKSYPISAADFIVALADDEESFVTDQLVFAALPKEDRPDGLPIIGFIDCQLT